MFLKSLLLTVLVFCVLQISVDSLKCHMCLGSKTSDCAKNVTSAMVMETCGKWPRHHGGPKPNFNGAQPPSPPPTSETNSTVESSENYSTSERPRQRPRPRPHHHKFDEYCVYFTTKADNSSSSRAERGCGYIFHNVDICKFIKDKSSSVDDCMACQTDNCN